MAETRLKLIIDALDNASDDFKALKKEMEGLNQAAKGTKGGFSEFEKAMLGMKSQFNLLNSDIVIGGKNLGNLQGAMGALGISLPITPLQAFAEGLKIVGQFAAQSVKETEEYAKTVREMSGSLSIGTEEASRLIQMFDDFGVSAGEVQQIMNMAVKKGFAPTIEGLAQMADQLNAIKDPTQRAAQMSETFGKNWARVNEVLRQGGDAVRAQAAAVSDSLVMTEEQVKQSREWEIAQDNVNDAIQGVKYTIGNQFIPVLTDLANALAAAMKSEKDAAKEARLLGEEMAIQAGKMQTSVVASYQDYLEQIREVIKGQGDLKKSADGTYRIIQDNGMGAVRDITEEFGFMQESEYNVRVETERYRETLMHLGPDLSGVTAATAYLNVGNGELLKSLESNVKAFENMKPSLDAVSFGIRGGLAKATEDYTTSLGALQVEHDKLTVQLQTLLNGPGGYAANQKGVFDLTGKIRDNETAQKDVEEQMKRTTAQLIYQQAAAGLDADASLALANKLGLLSDQDYETALAIEFLKKQMDPKNPEAYADAIAYIRDAAADGKITTEEMGKALDILNGKKATATLEVKVTGDQIPDIFKDKGSGKGQGGGPVGKKAAGGPVNAGQGYLVGEQGPEFFVPSQSGFIVPNSQLNTTHGGAATNMNFYITSPVPITKEGDVMTNVKLMQMLYG